MRGHGTDDRIREFLRRLIQASTNNLRRRGMIVAGPQDVEETVFRSAGYTRRETGPATAAADEAGPFMTMLGNRHIALEDGRSVAAFFPAHPDMIAPARATLSKIYAAFGDHVRPTAGLRNSACCEFHVCVTSDPEEADKIIRRINRSLRVSHDQRAGSIVVTASRSFR